jgi:hypothetical protein
VIDRHSIVDIGSGAAQRLIRESLQPQNARKRHASGHLLVELKPDSMRPLKWSDIAREHSLEVQPRAPLVAKEMQRSAGQSVADQSIVFIGFFPGKVGKSFC